MKKLSKIKEIIKQHKKELEQRFKVKEIGVFGSYVRSKVCSRNFQVALISQALSLAATK